MILDLPRISTHPHFGTFGALKWREDPAPFAVSLEDPWKNNQKNISCIPEGEYNCHLFMSPTHGPTFQVMAVPNRTYILFHKGNTHINTAGCILIAESYDFLGGIPSVKSSAVGFNEFWNRVKDVDEFTLHISWI